MKRVVSSKAAWLFALSALVLFLVIGAGPASANPIPNLMVGLCTDSSSPCTTFVGYTTVGSDVDTAFGLLSSSVTVWIGGAAGIDGGNYGSPIGTYLAPILMVSVPDGSTLSGITVNGAGPVATGTVDPGYLPNHYPTDGSGTTADFMYFNLYSALGDGVFNAATYRNFADLTDTGTGQEVALTVGITGSFDWVHFDLIGDPTCQQQGQDPCGRIAVISNPGSHDVTLVPEPGTLLLLGTGLIGAAGFARRKWLASR